jgi:hypothetical protein
MTVTLRATGYIFRLIYKWAQPVRRVVDHFVAGLEKDQAELLVLELLALEPQEAVAGLVLAHQVVRYMEESDFSNTE